jgi:hypothetical protein
MAGVDVGEYCRELEAYLCRKNDGHLIRIAGPAFETVSGWAQQGIPLKIAFQGVDRYFERYYSRGPRRRPVRIEFCEADILDAFDDWRRAVGVAAGADDAPTHSTASPPSLPAHLQRVLQKLTTARTEAAREGLAAALDAAIDAVEEIRQRATSARGEARAALLDRLEDIESALLSQVRAALFPEALDALVSEAEQELAGFAPRMTREAHAQAVAAATERLIRLRAGLPRIAYMG